MAESNYIPNSQKYKDEKKKTEEHHAEKVVTGEVKRKKKGVFSKFLEMFLPEDVGDIRHWLIYGVFIPEIKRIASETLDGIMYGSRGAPSTSSRRVDQVSYGGQRNYQKYSSSTAKNNGMDRGRSYDPPIYANRGDAEVVLSQMLDIIDEYGFVSILDMLDLAGITGDYTDAKYGWNDLREARVIPVSGGYMIELPKAVSIDYES